MDNYSDSDCEDTAVDDIEQSLTEWSPEKTNESTIVIVTFNVVVKDINDKYYPNEIGMTRMSITDGVQHGYSKLIQNTHPQGFYGTADKFSKDTHKIPINTIDVPEFCGDYHQLFNEIYLFMDASSFKDRKGRKIVFCKTIDSRSNVEDMPQVIGSLEWMDNKVNAGQKPGARSLCRDFVVIDIVELLFLMTKTCCRQNRAKALLIDDLNSCRYDYKANMRCEFHDETENNYCALFATKRTAYLLIDAILSIGFKTEYEVKPKDTHIPKNILIESESSIFKGSEIPRVPLNSYKLFPHNTRSPYANVVNNQVTTNKQSPTPGSGMGRGRSTNWSKNSGNRYN
ncbi:protein maelstrom homolog isoform X2 [Oppia nitens]|nr:protein maelstrom homolog isoform X2 [Oppia nitens]